MQRIKLAALLSASLVVVNLVSMSVNGSVIGGAGCNSTNCVTSVCITKIQPVTIRGGDSCPNAGLGCVSMQCDAMKIQTCFVSPQGAGCNQGDVQKGVSCSNCSANVCGCAGKDGSCNACPCNNLSSPVSGPSPVNACTAR